MLYWYLYLRETLREGLLRDSAGQGMVEYAVILGLVLVGSAGAFTLFGNDLSGLYSGINQGIDSSFEAKSWFYG